MNDIILPCCGGAVSAPPRELDCPACGTHFSEQQVDGVQIQEITSVPVVDVLRAAKMLNQPEEWIVHNRQLLDPMPGAALGLSFVFPLTAISRFATERNLSITPLSPTNGALWLQQESNTL